MGKSNAQRQAAWRQRAREAREFQRQHQGYTAPPGYVLVPQHTWDWVHREIERLPEQPAAPAPQAESALLVRLQAAYSAAACDAARHVIAYGLEALTECEADIDADQHVRDCDALKTWSQVFERPVSEDVLLSVAEAAGRRAGETLPAETVLDILSKRSEAEKQRAAAAALPRRRRRRA